MTHVAKALNHPDFAVPLPMSESDRSLLAGLLIGEGTITLSGQGRRGTGIPYYSPEVHLSNTDLRVVRWIADLFTRVGLKASVSQMNAKRRRKPTHRLQYKVTVDGLFSVHRLLLTIRPVLFAKGEQADEVLAFIALRQRALASWHGRFGNPPRQTSAEALIVDNVRLLNRRGV